MALACNSSVRGMDFGRSMPIMIPPVPRRMPARSWREGRLRVLDVEVVDDTDDRANESVGSGCTPMPEERDGATTPVSMEFD